MKATKKGLRGQRTGLISDSSEAVVEQGDSGARASTDPAPQMQEEMPMEVINAEQDVQLEDGPAGARDQRVATPERAPPVKTRPEDDDNGGSKVRRIVDEPDEAMPEPADEMATDLDTVAGSELDRTDKAILAAVILGADITEVYSPERVNRVAAKFSLAKGSSLDLLAGWDLSKVEQRNACWQRVKKEDPYFIIGSPPCTLPSLLQEFSIKANRDNPRWMVEFNRRLAEAMEHVSFCCMLYRYQLRRGRHFLHEHPWTARSWQLDSIREILAHPGVQLVEGHMCQFLLRTHIEQDGGELGLVKKPTGFVTSSECLAAALNVRCSGDHKHAHLVGGRAGAAATYPEALCEAIVKGVIKQQKVDALNRVSTGKMGKGQLSSFVVQLCGDLRRERLAAGIGGCSSVVRDGGRFRPVGDWPADWVDIVHEEDGGCDDRGVRPQKGAEILRDVMYGLVCKNSIWRAWDDVSNVDLNVEDVLKARALEMEYFAKLRVYDRVDRSEIARTGGKLIGTRWVDTNKGDSTNVDVRSRLVGREFNVGRDDALYAATPPLEALRVIISHAATFTCGSAHREVMVNDVRRAYFYAKIGRDFFIELPPEDPEHDSGKVGKLRLCLYGTRDAAKGWQETLSAHLVSLGFTRGVGHPSVFHHPSRNILTLVHGDDYVSSGSGPDMHWLEEALAKAYEIKTQRLGHGGGKLQGEGKVLHRVLRASEAGWEIEADPRHAELVIEQLGVEQEKGVATPGVPGTEEDDLPEDVPLQGENIRCFRGVAARCNYLGPDRPDAQFAIKECCREMAAPTMGSLRRLRRIGKYFKNFPRLVWKFDMQ